MRMAGVWFQAVAGVALAFAVVLHFPTRSLVISHHGQGRPHLKLPEANSSKRICYSRGVVEVSLDEDLNWVAWDLRAGTNEGLGWYLAHRSEGLQKRGVWPTLRLRVSADAPARYMVAATAQARRCGYKRLLVAVCQES